MIETNPTLSFDHFSNIIHHAKESLEILDALENVKANTSKCPPLSSVLATYILNDLYSDTSSDEANINRITTNLEAAANDILFMSTLIRNLGKRASH
jgi:hypothetical protein